MINSAQEPSDDLIILVDEHDNQIGVSDKLSVHQRGLLHRAFSVFIFNSKGELLLQQRADTKYHSPGLWSNTCCSHPKPGEMTQVACERRLMEEMGLLCELKTGFTFVYRFAFANGLVEHEFDHVFLGRTDTLPRLNPHEVRDWQYMKLTDLEQDITLQPEKYTAWLKICVPKLADYLTLF